MEGGTREEEETKVREGRDTRRCRSSFLFLDYRATRQIRKRKADHEGGLDTGASPGYVYTLHAPTGHSLQPRAKAKSHGKNQSDIQCVPGQPRMAWPSPLKPKLSE